MTAKSPKISAFSIILIFVFFSLVGLTLVVKLPVKLSPSQNIPQITVSFSMLGASPLVVEKEVTSKLESLLNRMKGVRRITSNSINGRGSITIYLDKSIKSETARFEVSAIVRQAWSSLPDNVTYPSIAMRSVSGSERKTFMTYTLIADESSVKILEFAENTIKNNIAQIDGIYQVNIMGANQMQWLLEYDSEKLAQIGISLSDLQTAIGQHLRNESLGIVSTKNEKSNVETIRIALTPDTDLNEEDLRNIPVKKTAGGRIIYLSDCVRIKYTEIIPGSYYRINGKNTIYISIVAETSVNQLELSKRIKLAVDKLQKSFPQDYGIQMAYDATEYISAELEKIYFRTGLTMTILLLFVFFTYRRIKYSLLIVISLIVNIAVAVIFYFIAKTEIQLYSLAGLTVSLTLIIDNCIIFSDQIINRHNKKAYTAILAATLTTICSLSVIFFLSETMQLNLLDFAKIIIINLLVSLLITLFLVPALIEKLKLEYPYSQKTKQNKIKRILLIFNRFYKLLITFLVKRRVIAVIIIVLIFGLPVFLLPEKIEKENLWAKTYNSTVGSEFYREKLRIHVNRWFGGTWRLFVEKVYNGSYWNSERQETALNITASMPNGTTLEQINFLIGKMENYISGFSGIRQFETNISNPNRASVEIRFIKQHQNDGYPYRVKSAIINKGLELGGGSWAVYGVGDGFSNDVKENAGNYRVEMLGYNYDELYEQAEKFKERLLTYRRIKEVTIESEFSWYKSDYQEFSFDINAERMATANIQPYQLYMAMRPVYARNVYAGKIQKQTNSENIVLTSKHASEYKIWDLKNRPLGRNAEFLKLGEMVEIDKYQSPRAIAKENQNYRLCIQYEYIGAWQQGSNVLEENIEAFAKELPAGYTIRASQNSRNRWGKAENSQYWLLAIVFIIIFFFSAILFNSLRQALYVVFIIPLSFIGLFLTFYLFKLNFDNGGFAAFILLSGLTVNANIYIINEYNNIRQSIPVSPLKAYIKAWNYKVRPIFLTLFSTVLGFIPFIIGYREAFWYPLAVGVIGGLIFAFFITFLFLPIAMSRELKKNHNIFIEK